MKNKQRERSRRRASSIPRARTYDCLGINDYCALVLEDDLFLGERIEPNPTRFRKPLRKCKYKGMIPKRNLSGLSGFYIS